MLVKKIADAYEFQSPTTDGAFIVKLILTPDGREQVSTIPVGSPTVLDTRHLEPGTIRTVIGEERWRNFVRMKEDAVAAMFIDPSTAGAGSRLHKFTS
jgi:hypothetical protein